MIEVAEELIEAMGGRQMLISVAEVILSELSRYIAVVLQELCNGGVLILNTLLCARHADGQKARAEGVLAQNEGGTAGGAALLGIGIGEERAFGSDTVDIRRGAAHHAAMIGADVPGTDIVSPDNQNIGFLRR